MSEAPADSGNTFAVRMRAGFGTIPVCISSVLFALGILLARVLWLRPGMLLCAICAFMALCAIAAVCASRIVWLPITMLWVGLGVWCAQMEPQPSPDPGLLRLSDGLLREIDGTVVDAAPARILDEDAQDGPDEIMQRVDVRLDSIELVDDTRDEPVPNRGGVRLTIRAPGVNFARLRCGERVHAAVRLLPPHDYRNPGGWGRTNYLLEQGITSTASVRIDRVDRLGDSAPSMACFWREMQHRTTERLIGLSAMMQRLPVFFRITPEDAAMLSAMLGGDRTFLTHQLRLGFERTGSFHMLVVAGLHLAIVAGLVFWIAKRLRIPQLPATLVTIALATAYALFTGFATPVQRSLLMVILYLVGRLFYRERSVLNTIGFAAIFLLAASPRALFESSFQMTLLAVIAIGGIAAPLLQRTITPYLIALKNLPQIGLDAKLPPYIAQYRVTLRMFANRLRQAGYSRLGWRILPGTQRWFLRGLEAVVVSIVIELAMTLPMAAYFHRLTLFALPVNVCIIPILIGLLPAALATAILLHLWPAAAVVAGCLTAFLLHLGTTAVQFFGSLRWADFRIPAPAVWQITVFCALLGAAILFAHSQERWMRRCTWIVLIFVTVIVLVPIPLARPAGALLLQVLDVGQGDSILLITPDGKTLLVDAGGPSGGIRSRVTEKEFDIGEEVVSPALWARGIRHLDVVALSHAHSDHMGGMIAILHNFHPDELWVGNNPQTPSYAALLDEARRMHTNVRQLHAGDVSQLGRVRLDVLAPFADYKPSAEPANNDSLVMRAQFEANSVLLEGDAEAPIEARMLSEPNLRSTLLKVGHHGSVTSTEADFLARVAPRWAVISCGLNNRYGHPRGEVLDELQSAHVHTFSTDIDGGVCFHLDGVNVQPVPCR